MNLELVYLFICDYIVYFDFLLGRWLFCVGVLCILFGFLYYIKKKVCVYNLIVYVFNRIIKFFCMCCRDDLCIFNLYGLYYLYIYGFF